MPQITIDELTARVAEAARGKAGVAALFALISNVHCSLRDAEVGEEHGIGAVREVSCVGKQASFRVKTRAL